MLFTPFAFIQSAAAATIPVVSLQGYFIGGGFTSYTNNDRPYFRILDTTGSISSSFNIGAGFNNSTFTFATQSDGKIIVGGDFSTYSGSSQNRIVRLNTNGTIDTSFNVGTAFDTSVFTTNVQSDGKVIVTGNFASYSGSAINRIVRINTDGTRDTTYNVGAGFNAQTISTVIQSDGKVVSIGSFTTYSGSTSQYIVRINTDGTRDTTFNVGVGFNLVPGGLAIQSDDKLLVGGNFTTYSGSASTRVIRLNTNGTRDTTFNVGVGFGSPPSRIAIQSDGKILLIGNNLTSYSGSTVPNIVRLNTNGTRDTTFNAGTIYTNTSTAAITNIHIQSDGKIILQGNLAAYSGSTISTSTFRVNSDGTLDTTFNATPSTNTATGTGNPILQLNNQSILIGGNFTGPRVGYYTFTDTQGNLTQRSAVQSYGFSSTVQESLLLSGSKILLAGDFQTYSGSAQLRAVLINPDGTRDTSFNIGAGFGAGGTLFGLATQSNGQILIGGGYTTYSGSSALRIVRLNTNGTRDTSFNIGTGFNSNVSAIAVQSDGKIIPVGTYTTYSGSSVSNIVRLNTNGTIDTSFNIGNGFNNSSANSIIIQPDQKPVVGGAFATYSGSSSNGIVRINTNGTRDTSFNIGTGFGAAVNRVAAQSDGKILAGGAFTTYSGSTKNYIVRLNTNGTADTGSSWNQGTGFNNQINSIAVQDDGKIIVGGVFTTYSGSSVPNIVRLNTDGTRDTTFLVTGSGFNSNVRTIIPYYSES